MKVRFSRDLKEVYIDYECERLNFTQKRVMSREEYIQRCKRNHTYLEAQRLLAKCVEKRNAVSTLGTKQTRL